MPPVIAGWRAMYSRDPVTGDLYGIGVPPPPSPFIADGTEPVPLPVDFVWGDTSQVTPVGSNPLAMDHLSDVDTTTVAPVVGDLLVFDGTNWIPSEAAARTTIPATLPAEWTGIAEFAVNSVMVTMTLRNLKRSSQHGDGQTKILDYPAGVPSPFAQLAVFNHGMGIKSNGFSDLMTGVPALVLARTDYVSLLIMSNGADWGTDQAINVTISWAR